MTRNLKGPVFLLLCAFFWGMAFAAQSTAADHIGPYTFVFARCTITTIVLVAAFPFLNRLSGENAPDKPVASGKRHLIVGSLIGLVFVAATVFQQMGLSTTTTAKSGFITALYIVIVPIIGVFFGKRPRLTLWAGVGVSVLGLYLLCSEGQLNFNSGDLLTFACAIVFAIHIILIDRYGANLNSVKLSAIQFGVAAILAGILMLVFETPRLEDVLACWQSIIYAAVFSGALGYTFQIIGQKHTDPTIASLLLCLESVFAALGGWVLLNETLSPREVLGCALMLCASVVALLPSKSDRAA